MAYTGLYNADGQINLTVVDGTSYTGLYSPDGTWNIVINDGSVYKGYYHPCGAVNVVVNNSATTAQAPNGSLYVKTQTDGVGYTPVTSPGIPGSSGATDITMTAMTANDANAWAGKQVASFAASPAGTYVYSLTNDNNKQVVISRRGNLRLLKNPVSGTPIACTVSVVPLLGGTPFTKAFSISVSSYNVHSEIAEEWDANVIANLKQDSAKTIAVAADGDPVGSWVGSIQGWGWQKTGVTNRPIYKTSQFGTGNAGIRFAGNSASFMDAVDAALINYPAGTKRNWTVLVVSKMNADSAGSVISWANLTSPRAYVQNNLIGVQAVSTGQLPADTGNSAGFLLADDTNTTPTGCTSLYGHVANGSTMFMAFSRNDEIADTVFNGKANMMKDVTNTAAATMTQARLGQRVGVANNFFNGDIHYIALIPRYLTQYERVIAMRQIVAERTLNVTIPAEPAELDMTVFTQVYSEDFDGPTDNVLDYLNADYTRDRIEPTKLIPSQITSKTVDGSPGATYPSETGWMADPRATSAFVNNPTLSVANDKLVMTPNVTPAPLSANALGLPYLGASVISKGLVDLEQGAYFEVCVKIPTMAIGNRGTFTAPLWMLHSAGAWYPSEPDVMEQFGSGQAVANGTNRNMLASNTHNNYTWPMSAAAVTSSDSAYNGNLTAPVPHDLTADQHLIGARMTSTDLEVYLDRKLQRTISLVPHSLYGVTINNTGDGTIPAGNLTVIAKGNPDTASATLVFTTAAGVLTGAYTLTKGGARFPAAGSVTYFRSNGTTPLGYGIDLTASIGVETKRANIYNGLFYFLSNWAVSGSGIDGGVVDAGTLATRPMSIDWFMAYDKNIAIPSILVPEDPATTALMNKWSAVSYTPTAPQRAAVDNVIKYLKAYALREDTEINSGVPLNWDPATMASIWDRLAGLYNWYKIPVQAAALVDWKNPGGVVLGINGSPVFNSSFGVQFSSTIGEYLETSHGLGSSTLIDPWDNHMGLYVHEGTANTTWRHAIGGNSAASGFFASLGNSEVPVNPANNNYNSYNAPTISHGIKPVSSGHVAWIRNALLSTVLVNGRFWSGGYMTSQSTKPSKLAGSTMKFGASNSGVAGAAGKYRMGHYGAYITPSEAKIIKDQFDGMWTYF